MARKRKARANKNDLRMAYHVEGPRGMGRGKVFSAAIATIRSGGRVPLPAGVRITWRWQNSVPNGKWREGSFASVIKKSRTGFTSLMERRLTRDALAMVPGWTEPAPIREATPAEIRAIERQEKKFEQKREETNYPGGREVARARETKTKRSAAAKKGWATRRAAAKQKGKKRK